MEDYLKSLNEKQREAVLATEGPVLIVAGAGAGKTKTITHRIFHLVRTGVAPRNILAITFTNKAAREMRERVMKLLEEESREKKSHKKIDFPAISTFHALGVEIIKQNAKLLGLPRYWSIYDKSDAKRIIKEVLVSLGYDPKQFDPARIQNAISREKGNFVTAKEFAEKVGPEFFPKVVSAVWLRYEDALAGEQALDLDDLILVTAKLLAKNEEVRKYYQGIWKYIHIDEYQDTNSVQYHIARLLAQAHKNICVVGDTDQNIYSWRGADIKNMLRFEKDYPNAKIVMLEENYRSTKTILSAANAVIKKNNLRIEKNLFTRNHEGEKIGLFIGRNEIEEAEFVARRCEELLRAGVSPDEIAVLYRANFQSRLIEDAFFSRGLPYVMVGTKFFERKEVKDVLSFLRAALNPKSFADLKRIVNIPTGGVTRGIGPKTLEKILRQEERLPAAIEAKSDALFSLLTKIRIAISQKKPSEVIKFILKVTGLEETLSRGSDEEQERLENIMELATLALNYDNYPAEEGIERLLADAALATSEEEPGEGGESGEEKKSGVRLMTAHASKGLEFDYVFIVGLEQDLFPHHRINERNARSDEAEEERRLFYVALTRAKKKILLTYAQYRTIFGERNVGVPSEFIFDIDEKCVKREFAEQENADEADETGSGEGKRGFGGRLQSERFIEF